MRSWSSSRGSAEQRERRQCLNWRGRGGSRSSREGVLAPEREQKGERQHGRLLGFGKNKIFFFKIKIYKSAIKIQKARASRPIKKAQKVRALEGFWNGLPLPPSEAQHGAPRAFLRLGALGARFFKLRAGELRSLGRLSSTNFRLSFAASHHQHTFLTQRNYP